LKNAFLSSREVDISVPSTLREVLCGMRVMGTMGAYDKEVSHAEEEEEEEEAGS
jgi:hypothetical protein